METTIQKAINAHQEGRLKEAEQLYRSILESQPTNFVINSNLGALLFNLNKFDEAEASYKKTIELKPDHAKAHHNLGNLFYQLGKFDEAEASYKKTIELKPDHAKAHHNLGSTLQKLNKFDEAEASYKKTIELKPDYVEAHHNLGNLFYQLGKFDEAEASYKKAIELKPDYVEAHHNLGSTLQKLNKFDEAEASCKKVIELKPDHAGAHYNFGLILKKLNRPEEAEASLRKSIILNPDFIEVTKCIYKGDWQNSKRLLEKMCTVKIIDMNRNVAEFIRIWCVYCHELLTQGDIKRLTKILTKLFIIGERNQNINNLIKSYFNTVDIVKALELVELNDKILIKVSYCQYKFLTKDFVLSESLATSNIKETPNLLVNPETADLGWLVVRRSLALCKNKNIAREILNSLITNLGLTK
jgi:tetratricopeptide (TPR) repeat protein